MIAPTSGSFGPLGYFLTVIFFATSARLLPSKQAMWNTMPGCSDPGIVVLPYFERSGKRLGFRRKHSAMKLDSRACFPCVPKKSRIYAALSG